MKLPVSFTFRAEKAEGNFKLTALVAGSDVGELRYFYSSHKTGVEFLYVHGLVVIEKHRNNGIASQMLDALQGAPLRLFSTFWHVLAHPARRTCANAV